MEIYKRIIIHLQLPFLPSFRFLYLCLLVKDIGYNTMEGIWLLVIDLGLRVRGGGVEVILDFNLLSKNFSDIENGQLLPIEKTIQTI